MLHTKVKLVGFYGIRTSDFKICDPRSPQSKIHATWPPMYLSNFGHQSYTFLKLYHEPTFLKYNSLSHIYNSEWEYYKYLLWIDHSSDYFAILEKNVLWKQIFLHKLKLYFYNNLIKKRKIWRFRKTKHFCFSS